MSQIERSEGWRVNVIRGNPGRLSGGETVTFHETGRVLVDREGTDWNDVTWSASNGVAIGMLPDNRPFRVTLTDGPQPTLECRIAYAVLDDGDLKPEEQNDLDGESGGWTAQEGETPVGGAGTGTPRWKKKLPKIGRKRRTT